MSWNWNDTEIKLPQTFENLKALLSSICNNEHNFSHYEFAKWCNNLTMAFDDDEGEVLSEKDELAFAVARDIECQWDIYLPNTFTLVELQNLDLTKISLPHEWFEHWLRELL
ncbi:hypothetical protein [Robertmurraya korlensis]|uniref:hypothetical protein n=1 Tax=Robertmurraya korlensis TaxID=519977 RepID=UPI0008249BE5|nr:hypothetical protein [Robertmurraya korlensis]